MQLVTTSSDGLVKLWNIKDEECVKTLDNHEDKVGSTDGVCVPFKSLDNEPSPQAIGFSHTFKHVKSSKLHNRTDLSAAPDAMILVGLCGLGVVASGWHMQGSPTRCVDGQVQSKR
jgi:WD40 repeat protein